MDDYNDGGDDGDHYTSSHFKYAFHISPIFLFVISSLGHFVDIHEYESFLCFCS